MREPPPISPSHSDSLSLEAVVARLARHEVVTGIVLLGSTGAPALTAASDYDLLIVLSAMPAPLHVAVTTIDKRLADIIFITQSEIERLLARDQEIPQDSWEARLLHWVQTGRIAFDRITPDRVGLLHQLRQKAASLPLATQPDMGERYRTWFGVNYNLVQTQRILESPDPVYQMTVDLRLLYCLSELWGAYFRLRGLVWAGEKAAIRYLAEHDPGYLARFQRCLAEADRRAKVEQYAALAAEALAPLGGIWPAATTAIQFHAVEPWVPGQEQVALDFWNSLID